MDLINGLTSKLLDQSKLVIIIKQYQQIWDRNHPYFRDKVIKDKAWDEIAAKIGFPVEVCKETFKSIREKYIREREKLMQYGEYYRGWDLIHDLKFLDPNIVPRKIPMLSGDDNSQKPEELRSNISHSDAHFDNSQTDFDRALISLVCKNIPIWDRNSNIYPNKRMKNELWQHIAQTLNKEVNGCMLRWKALREKYIRQKLKFNEGDAKWELLDAMSFLDKVIQYRRKQSDHSYYMQRRSYDLGCSYYQQNSSYQEQSQENLSQENEYSHIQCNFENADDNSYADSSSNDFITIVKQESAVLLEEKQESAAQLSKQESTVLQVADSSYNGENSCSFRKRSASINSEGPSDKRLRSEENDMAEQKANANYERQEQEQNARTVEHQEGKVKTKEPVDEKLKTPEQLFGDLVALLLSKKPEKDKNMYMIEIMTVLSK